MEMMTGREAAECLGRLSLGREPARRALLAGVAGPGIRTRGTLLYEATEVHAAVERALDPPVPGWADGAATFVGRVAPRTPEPDGSWRAWRGADLTAPAGEQRDAVRAWWHLSIWTRVWIGSRSRLHGFFPFIATVSGFVAVGADIVSLDQSLDGEAAGMLRAKPRARPSYRPAMPTAFVLREPGTWFDPLRGRRLGTGPGGPFSIISSRTLRPTLPD